MKNFSIIVPVFNAQATLEACLEAIIKTKDFSDECELIVADDASTDDSLKIAQKYGAKIVSTSVNKGAGFVRNLGAQAAQGKILIFIDSDVVLLCDDILKQLGEDFKQDGICGIAGIYYDQPAFNNFASAYKHFYMCFGRRASPILSAVASSAIMAVKSADFHESGGFLDYPGVMAEDVEFSIRLALKKNKLWRLDERLKGRHLKKYSLQGLFKTNFSRVRGIAKALQKKDYQRLYLQSCGSYFVRLTFLSITTWGLLVLSAFWDFFILGALASFLLFILVQLKFLKYLKDKKDWRFALLSIFFSFFEMSLAAGYAFFWQIVYKIKNK